MDVKALTKKAFRKPVMGSVVYLSSGDSVLLHRRRGGVLEGYVGLPGGKIEFGESPLAAGVRELREETGLVADSADVVGVYSVVNVSDGTPRGHYVLFVVKTKSFHGSLAKATGEGENFWMRKSDVRTVSRVLPDLFYVLEHVEDEGPFIEHMTRFSQDSRLMVVTSRGKEYYST